MDSKILERVVIDQQEELQDILSRPLCHRQEEQFIDLNSHLAQIVIGVRRSGKSTLCMNALNNSKVSYAYVNLDDDRLMDMSASDFDNMLECLYKVYGDFTHLFLDEVQNIEGWHLFVNRMLRRGMHIVVTGSNSKLLSSELSTHLTGRHHVIELFPFSFFDFCNYHGMAMSPLSTRTRGLLQRLFDEYMQQGGFPELLVESNAKSYISSLLQNIVTQDIQRRFSVRHTDTFLRLVNHLLNVTPAIIVRKRLMLLFDISSAHTLGNYLSYLSQTYLISPVTKYSTKSSLRTTGEKCYAIDVAFMNNRPDAFVGKNLGWRMETIVYLELRRRATTVNYDVYYYAERSAEADFIVCEANQPLAVYQVCYSIDSPRTRNREIRGAVAAAKATHVKETYIITYNESETINVDGIVIQVIPIWEWLVKR